MPARSGSRGCPGKNLRTLGGKTLIELACDIALDAGCDCVVSTDMEAAIRNRMLFFADQEGNGPTRYRALLRRPPDLAQDDTPMIDVVKHALAQIPGPPEQIVILLQPTQPFRTPEHVTAAIALLQESGADSVVSVVPLPLTHSPELALRAPVERLEPCDWDMSDLMDLPKRRQDVEPAYIRDGTVYAFWRKTVTTWNSIYGLRALPLIIDPADSCELDTEADWREVERRWKERHGG